MNNPANPAWAKIGKGHAGLLELFQEWRGGPGWQGSDECRAWVGAVMPAPFKEGCPLEVIRTPEVDRPG